MLKCMSVLAASNSFRNWLETRMNREIEFKRYCFLTAMVAEQSTSKGQIIEGLVAAIEPPLIDWLDLHSR